MTKTLATILALILSSAVALAGDDLEIPQMEIGTNFWDIGWGGPKNQPFKTPWNRFEPANSTTRSARWKSTRYSLMRSAASEIGWSSSWGAAWATRSIAIRTAGP